ncbi:hypothetical protein BT96DRAFT_1003410 [Gymnopus androsaceus JB14]|uniref:Uncharacterized protein n=1 Tax=Gymnopus androsaceus JB14 TaxID=1447944 RepID=A0A6A4GVY5_9AGAR|nr:hypothetical protein BT96DRAFT_1003410 [Gymnopus androsaceus JB14]
MYNMHADTRTEYGLYYYESSSGNSSSSEQQHPPHPSIHPRSIDYPGYLNFAEEHRILPGYLNLAPEHKHLQLPRGRIMSSSSHSTHSSSCSIPHVNTHLSAVPHLILVPQKVYRNQSYHIREPSVTFRTKGSSELGVQIFDISHVEGKRETPLPELVYRSLNVRINWPGYEPSVGRIKLCEDKPTRIFLLSELARILRDFFRRPVPFGNGAQDWNMGRIDTNATKTSHSLILSELYMVPDQEMTERLTSGHNLTLPPIRDTHRSLSSLPLPLHVHILNRPSSTNPSLLRPNSAFDSASASTIISPLRLTDGAAKYTLVPQRVYSYQLVSSIEQSSLVFQRKGGSEPGVPISRCLGRAVPEIQGMLESPFQDLVYREVTIHIEWPGYAHFGRRITKLRPGNDLSKVDLLCTVAHIIEDFFKCIKKSHLVCEPAQKRWDLQGVDLERLCITRLIHLGGSIWQPEIWCPVFDT